MPATVIFFLLIIISLFVAERKGYEGLYSFDKVTTLPLRGALALLILATHLGPRTSIPVISDFTSHIGFQIVAIFFFISGYGLCVSYLSKGEDYLEGFLNRRLGKLLPKFILLTLGMMLITHFLGSVTLVQHAKYFVFEGITPLPHSWFILAILYIYITFYLCSFIVKKPALLGILFTITTLFYFVIMAKILQYRLHWYITILCVNLGYFTACYEKTITTIIEKNKVLCYSLIAIALVSTFGLKELYGELFTPLWTMTQAFSLYIVIRTMRFIQWRWLRKIGILSLEIYLIHGIPIKIGQSLGLTNWTLWAFAYSITIPSAILLNKIFDLLSQNKILYKLNMNRSN